MRRSLVGMSVRRVAIAGPLLARVGELAPGRGDPGQAAPKEGRLDPAVHEGGVAAERPRDRLERAAAQPVEGFEVAALLAGQARLVVVGRVEIGADLRQAELPGL